MHIRCAFIRLWSRIAIHVCSTRQINLCPWKANFFTPINYKMEIVTSIEAIHKKKFLAESPPELTISLG